ncbi:hypothetical protein RRG08_002116 [Elysia crispata]|uniref:VWFA domain-containing protein n=1 Tax=Elysia crispata TaxID=231223 RepID=A0AAE0XQI9_9GAST|nr:hypothetical protein RRG08_002116 [Elysia crispata]
MLRMTLGVLGLLGLFAVCCTAQQAVCSSNPLADVSFLVDASSYFQKSDASSTVDFLKSIVQAFLVGTDAVQFSLLTYRDRVQMPFLLYQRRDKSSVLTGLDETLNTQLTGSRSSTFLVLFFSRMVVLHPEYGARAKAASYVLLLTDSRPSNSAEAKSQAQLLKDEGTTVFVIGVGTAVDKSEIQNSLASSPEYGFIVSDFQSLMGVQNRIVQTICDGGTTSSSLPNQLTSSMRAVVQATTTTDFQYTTTTPALQYTTTTPPLQYTTTTPALQYTTTTPALQYTTTTPVLQYTTTTQDLLYTTTTPALQYTTTTPALQYTTTTPVLQYTTTTQDLLYTTTTPALQYTTTTPALLHKTTTPALQYTTTTPALEYTTTTPSLQHTTTTPSLQYTTTTPVLQYTTTTQSLQYMTTTPALQHTLTTPSLQYTTTTPSLQYTTTTPSLQGTTTTPHLLPTPTMPTSTSLPPTSPAPTSPTKPPSLPTQTNCSVTENEHLGDITVVCLVTSVYPKAGCRFYRITDGGPPTLLSSRSEYAHSQSGDGSAYNSVCQASVLVAELGAGTHTFRVQVYPNVTASEDVVHATTLAQNVTFSFPVASHSCPSSLLQDYLCGIPSQCTCSLLSPGRPTGLASWFYRGVSRITGPLTVFYDSNDPDLLYTCEAISTLGRKYGSTLKIETETTCG